MDAKWKAILIGGLITGLAPFVPFLNLACCVTPLAGALVAVAVYGSSSPPHPLSSNDGVFLGAMSGLIGTCIYAALVIPLVLLVGSIVGGFVGRVMPYLTEIPNTIRPILEGVTSRFANVLVFILLLKIISQLAFSLIFGTLGGLLGAAIFSRKSSPAG